MSSATSESSAEYAPSPAEWVRRQVEAYEASGGTKGNTMMGLPVVVLTMRGAKSGKVRKVPLMRVEHEGRYAAVASLALDDADLAEIDRAYPPPLRKQALQML